MAIQDLILRYVPGELQSRFRLHVGGEIDGFGTGIVFLATLWNGRSQLAFKRVVQCLVKMPAAPMVVLLTDDESKYGLSLQEIAPREHWSNGCVFAISQNGCVFLASGLDLDQIDEAIVATFLER